MNALKKIWLGSFLFLTALPAHAVVEPITPKEAFDLDAAGKAVIIDVREMGEVKETGIAKPAAWFPKSEVDAQSDLYKAFVKKGDKSKPLVFYCRSGKRAAVVGEHFQKIGFKTRNMGALSDWIDAGLPVVPFEQRR